jgi:hypothetical protein
MLNEPVTYASLIYIGLILAFIYLVYQKIMDDIWDHKTQEFMAFIEHLKDDDKE